MAMPEQFSNEFQTSALFEMLLIDDALEQYSKERLIEYLNRFPPNQHSELFSISHLKLTNEYTNKR